MHAQSSPLGVRGGSILIANRGEIASRIIRTCRKMGIQSVAVFSEADKDAPFVAQADTAIFIGKSNPAESYLDQDKIIEAAQKTGANAIHPGYGFLSENVNFAKKCAAKNIIFIGPHADAIAAMGSKSEAKILMKKHGVPVVPGYEGKDQSLEKLKSEAEKIGFPVLLKATAGGGGKGMRIVHKANEIATAIEAAKRESKSAFGDDELIVEKYIPSARHIEFQIFGDQHGNVIHILERECTIQRRYQKVIEESPSPVLSEALRQEMGAAAVNAAKALNYDNAGTVEFIFEEKTGQFYFLEVNTRLQVEHPVTEEITGLDLVQMQIESAQGLPLSISQPARSADGQDIHGNGYAIECRLYAEDATNDFLPVTGKIHRFEVPEVEGLRIETAIASGSEISIFYDPMIAKIIVWDKNRANALRKMQYVLRNLICQGITTNQDFLLHVLENQDFQQGIYDTHFIQNKIDLNHFSQQNKTAISYSGIAATLLDWKKREAARVLLKSLPSGWRNSFYDFQQDTYIFGEEEILVKYSFLNDAFFFKIEDEEYEVKLIAANEKTIRLEIDSIQHSFSVAQNENDYFIHNEQIGNVFLKQKERFPSKISEKVKGGYEAPMPSQIIKVLVQQGQQVKSGDGLIVLSSMKMENTVSASEDGVVEEIYAEEGGNVEAGFLLLKITNAD